VLLFTLAVSLAATLVFSLAPAFRTLRLSTTEALRDGARSTAGGRRQRLRGLLVVSEVALSVVLLLGPGLMLRSIWALHRIDVGFQPAGVLTVRLSLPESGYETPERVVAFYRALLGRVRAIPGVREAGILRSLPLGAPIGDWGLQIEGYVPPPGTHAKGDWQVASDGALEALGERLVRGRPFPSTDTADSEQVALVNETMARTYWPGRDAIGARLRQGSRTDRPWVSVVGVVADVRHNGVTAPVKEKFYRPHSQFHVSTGIASRGMNLVVKAAGDPTALAAPLRSAVRELDPNVPVAAVRRMTDVVSESLATPRLTGRLLLVFAALALALSAVGLYGLLSYLVGQRRQEIGIRLAIGADAAAIRRLVLGQGLRLALVGILVGTAAALAVSRVIASLLYGVSPHDPATFAVAPLVLLAAAVAASYLPARRATAVDPAVILRAE
jgi:predicted permease